MNSIFWLILTIILLVIELATSNLLSIWFVVSGLITFVVSLFIDDIVLECVIFMILGILLLFVFRRIVKNSREGKKK